mgnify:CR=1 FL=1
MSIYEVVEKDINEALAIHSGSAKVERFEDGTLYLSLHGGCAGCPSSKITLFSYIEPVIKERCPEVLEVLLV